MKLKYPALALTITAVANALSAGTLYLDTNGSAAGFGFLNASSTVNWDDAVWTTDATGQSATTNWVAGSDAVLNAARLTLQISTGTTNKDVASITSNIQSLTIFGATGTAKLTHNGDVAINVTDMTYSLRILNSIDVGSNAISNYSTGTLTLDGSNTAGSFENVGDAASTTIIQNDNALGQGTVNHTAGLLDLRADVTAPVITGNITSKTLKGAYQGTVIVTNDLIPRTDITEYYSDLSFGQATVIMREGALGFRADNIILEGPNAKFEISNDNQASLNIDSLTAHDGTIAIHGIQHVAISNSLSITSGACTQAIDAFTGNGTPHLEYYLAINGAGRIEVFGTAQLAGILDVKFEQDVDFSSFLNNGALDHSMELLKFNGSVTGSFEEITLPDLPEGYVWDTSEFNAANNFALTLRASNVPEPAAVAALAGLLALSFSATRRRRRNA